MQDGLQSGRHDVQVAGHDADLGPDRLVLCLSCRDIQFRPKRLRVADEMLDGGSLGEESPS